MYNKSIFANKTTLENNQTHVNNVSSAAYMVVHLSLVAETTSRSLHLDVQASSNDISR